MKLSTFARITICCARFICSSTNCIANRPWPPWPRIIGHRIALHAGLRYDVSGAMGMREEGLYDPPPDALCPKGCIVGTFRVTGYVEESDDPWFIGPFGWLLADVVALDRPVPCRGAQGLWKVPEEVWTPSSPTPVPQMELFDSE